MRLSYLKNGRVYSEDTHCTFDRTCDLCVTGLGTAGAIAALKGASLGLDTVGVERCKRIGGLGVNGGVFGYYYGSKNGFFTQINEKCYEKEKYGYIPSVTDRRIEDAVSPTVKSYVLNKSAEEYGCDIYTDTDVCAVYSEGRKIIGIKCLREGKVINISAKIFIDCSSSAVLARCFGCEMLGGREYDGGKMHYSKAVGKSTNFIFKDMSTGWFHHDYTHLPDFSEEMRINGVWKIYGMPNLSSPEQYCKSLLNCSSENPCNEDRAKEPLIYLGSIPGERETYHVKTERVLSLADAVNGTKFNEPLFYTFAPLDCTNGDCGFESPLLQDWRYCVADMGFSIGIEKEVLIAKDADNLLTAGKIIGVSHDIAGGIRMKADMEKCGEAAAAVAFCAIDDDCTIRNTDYNKLSQILRESNCLSEKDNLHYAELRRPLGTKRKSYAFPQSAEDIKKEFESPTASRALWKTAYLLKDSEREILKEWIKSGSEVFKINCAIALGMSGSQYGKNILTDFINRCAPVPSEALNNAVYSQYIKALSLAERFCWIEVKYAMKEILKTFGENIYPAEYERFRLILTSICIGAFGAFVKKYPELEYELCTFLKNMPKPPADSKLEAVYNNIPYLK